MNCKLLYMSLFILFVLAVSVTGAGAQAGVSPAAVDVSNAPIGTAFTYQGYLTDGGAPANGLFDFQFSLYTAPTGDSLVKSLPSQRIEVVDGLFKAILDFGSSAFNGDARYLEISVGSTPLNPRQELKPAPYALALPGVVPLEGKVGVGISDPAAPFHVQSKDKGWVARFENTETTGAPDVLLLKVGYFNTDTPDANNFVSFVVGEGGTGGDTEFIGAIDGVIGADGKKSVTYRSGSGDFAEWLPRLHADEVTEPGDIVGLFGGKIAMSTQDADQVHVISTAPIVLGNMPDEESTSLYEKVAFVGQVPVKVRGVVQIGDYIIPSGLNDGAGVAVSPQGLTLQHAAQIVGRAWESSSEEGVKLITVAVGLPQDQVWYSLYQKQVAHVSDLETQIVILQQQNADLVERLTTLERARDGGVR